MLKVLGALVVCLVVIGLVSWNRTPVKGVGNKVMDKAMEEFNNRKRHKVLTPEVLGIIQDVDLLQAIMDYVYDEVVKDDWAHQFEVIGKLPVGFRYVHALWELEAEVNNGGFNQYFYNSSGQFAQVAHEACLAIGASRTADILARAVETLLSEADMQLRVRKAGTIEAFAKSYDETKLNGLDGEFFKYEDDLQGLMVEYVRNNPEAFE